ncbi:MAG: hypothetical protein V3S51_00615, partial [Dehalococcoidia bacterium]
PTRIWRALRYEQRLGFKLEPATEELLRRDVGMICKVSGDRIRHELERILDEERPEIVIRRADELGVLQQLLPSLEGNSWLAKRFEGVREASPGSKVDRVLYLALLAWRLDDEHVSSLVDRLRFGRGEARVLRDIPGLRQILQTLEAQDLMRSDMCRLLQRHHPQAMRAAALAVESEVVRQRLELYLSTLRFVSPSLDGNDLKQMGVPSGKKLGWLLRALKDARLDGQVTTREQEQDMVRQWLVESKR